MKTYHTMLSIAGSDSSGGAGIQADLKTCTALGVYGMTAITALTAQNTCGVSGVYVTPPAALGAQLEAVVRDIVPDAVKTGMIPTAEHVRLVAKFAREHKLQNLVVDPVMVATSGDALCEQDAKAAFLNELLPLARVVTPNIPEAQELTGIAITDRASMMTAALELLKLTGCKSVLLKGGHGIEANRHADLLLLGAYELKQDPAPGHFAEPIWLEHPHIETPNTHGTGCTLSTAIASYLAMGYDVAEAVRCAVKWLGQAIALGADYTIGHGRGPVNHMFQINKNC
ncbi:MAG: bifunctional hydroxymethylpyrimidine kinase/phosphomethylpyrimidine kinase [Muribaculaceae bacterium]|nr:bifunctional hydroxymethylpyrimidine kinase/phosphomethylpyrimidine kinase [Muribaculaceae bacterium]